MKSRYRLRFSWRGVTTQIFVLIVLPLSVLVIVVAFGGLSLHRASMRTMVGDRDERAVRAAASAIAEQLNHRVKAIRGLSLLTGETFNPEIEQEVLRASNYLLEDFDYGMAYYLRGGNLQAFIGDEEFWETLEPSSPSLETELMRDAPAPLLVLTHPISNASVILVLAVNEKGGPVAVGAFNPASLARQALASIFNTDSKSTVYLVDASGAFLYQSGDPGSESLENHPGIQEALAGNSGTDYVQVPGGEHVVSYSPINPPGWALVIEEPWEAVTPPLLRTTEYAPFVLIPAFLLALLALWFGVRQIVLPLQNLESRAAELGRGHYEAIEEPVGGIAEIQHLQDELVNLAHKVKVAQTGLRSYIGAITTGQEDERRRLARELHDDTLQSLIALNQRIQLARLAAKDDRAASALDEIQQLAGQTIIDLRRITAALRPIYLEDLGLIAALEMLAREITELTGLPVHFRQTGESRRLDKQTELALFRMAQEALNNVARHARASRAIMEIVFDTNEVILHIKDDGQGFTPPETPAEISPLGHFGLLGIHERADLIGARLEIHSEIGAGTHILIACPRT